MLRNVDGKSANPLPRQLCCRGKGENIYDCQMRTNGPQRYVSHISFLPEAFESGAPVINLKGIIITTIAQSNALRRHLPSICDTCSVDSPCVIGRSIPIIEAEVGKLPADHIGTVHLIILAIVGNQGCEAVVTTRNITAATRKTAIPKRDVLVESSTNILAAGIQELNVHMHFCSADGFDHNLRIGCIARCNIAVHDLAVSRNSGFSIAVSALALMTKPDGNL